ncbi:MAG TPA: carboxypeptidase-like regulatory domain-containing protein [Vicinamibacterales bacterium]
MRRCSGRSGIETYLTAREQYLVYGRDYGFPNIVMSAPEYGTKLLRDATRDLEFLDGMPGNARGVSVNGVLEVDESDTAHIGSDVRPLPNIAVRLSSATFTAAAFTAGDGQFALDGMPPGIYTAQPQLPNDLALTDTLTPIVSITSAGGCASLPLRAVPNGRIKGVLKNLVGAPLSGVSVALMPEELAADEPDRYFQSVRVDADGRFEFAHVRPGRYILGRLSFTLNGQHVAAVYYPGVATRNGASLITIGEFLIPTLNKH